MGTRCTALGYSGRAVPFTRTSNMCSSSPKSLSATTNDITYSKWEQLGTGSLTKLVFVIWSYLKKAFSFSVQSLGNGYLMKSAVERMQGWSYVSCLYCVFCEPMS